MSNTVAETVAEPAMEQSEEMINDEATDGDTSKDPYNFRNPLLYSVPGSPGCSYIKDIVLNLIEPLKQELKANNHRLTQELQDTKHRLTQVEHDNKMLQEKVIRMEGFSRRYNLKFNGIREAKYENKQDCKRTIRNILMQSGLNIPHKAIESAHRVGHKSTEQHRPRSILVKLFHLEDKEYIQLRSQNIRNSCNVTIEEDFPVEIEGKRKVLKTVLNAANKIVEPDGSKRYNAKLIVDKLTLNGRTYTSKTTNKLPEELKLYNITTPTKGAQTAFFTYHSPLSNHYIAEQVVDNRLFNCNEQYYMHAKAIRFSDHDSARKILMEKDPVIQKKIGSNIAGFNDNRWEECCIDVMRRGLTAKFQQNPDLKDFLLDTGNNFILEGNPRDKYWGTGLSIYDRRIWKSSAWIGSAQNNMGKLLEEVRRDINREESA